MSANIRETAIGVGYVAQANIATANVSANFKRFNKLNGGLMTPKLGTETDAGEIGNGLEFGTQAFKTAWDVRGSFEKYLSAEWIAFVLAYAFGGPSVTGSGPYTHVITLSDPVVNGIELPSFSVVEQIRPGGSSVIDRMAVGCVIEDFTLSIGTGPTRAAAKVACNFIGTGVLVEPSVITLPAVTSETLLPAAGLALTINGVNYVSSKNIISLEMNYRNNHRLDSGYFPGSGFQSAGVATSGSIRGRMERGDRMLDLKFVARYDASSSEWTKLKALTEGTAVLSLTGASGTSLSITEQRLIFSDVTVQETDNIVTVSVSCAALYHSSNGLISATVINAFPKVANEP